LLSRCVEHLRHLLPFVEQHRFVERANATSASARKAAALAARVRVS
jgi:hypothetical protein